MAATRVPILYMAFSVEIAVQRDGNQTRASLSVPLRYAQPVYRLQSQGQSRKAPKAGFDMDVSPVRSLSEKENLCASSVALCASVVALFRRNSTTETQSPTEDAQRRTIGKFLCTFGWQIFPIRHRMRAQ